MFDLLQRLLVREEAGKQKESRQFEESDKSFGRKAYLVLFAMFLHVGLWGKFSAK